MFVLMMTAPARCVRDAGPPPALDGTPLAAQFRYWVGESGRRYLSRVLPIAHAGDFAGAPVVLAALGAGGRREAVWIGLAGGEGFAAAVAAARAAGATEAHVHLLAGSERERADLVGDLRAALAAGLAPARAGCGSSAGDRGDVAA